MVAAIVEGVELEECPFCGAQANLKTEPMGTNGIPHYWGKCSNKLCGISTMATSSQESAAGLWNRRA